MQDSDDDYQDDGLSTNVAEKWYRIVTQREIASIDTNPVNQTENLEALVTAAMPMSPMKRLLRRLDHFMQSQLNKTK